MVDPRQVAKYVADRFGWGVPSSMTPAADGAMGRVWRPNTNDESYAVKELYWADRLLRKIPGRARQQLATYTALLSTTKASDRLWPATARLAGLPASARLLTLAAASAAT